MAGSDEPEDESWSEEGIEEIRATNEYVVGTDDEWLISILVRIARFPGVYIGGTDVCRLSSYVSGYMMARLDAGLPCEGAVLRNFMRWVTQAPGNHALERVIESHDPSTQNLTTFFRLFDQYLREHGREAGLSLKTTDA